MKTIESRLNDLEGKLKPDNSNAIVFMLDEYNGVTEGYFENREEREAYLDWRTKMVRKENKYNPSKVYLYLFDEKDVLKYLQEFKNFTLTGK
jgi:hypothetical protein